MAQRDIFGTIWTKFSDLLLEINSACIEVPADFELRCREKLSHTLILQLGARVMLTRNLDIEGGWVNGSLTVVTHLHHNCIID